MGTSLDSGLRLVGQASLLARRAASELDVARGGDEQIGPHDALALVLDLATLLELPAKGRRVGFRLRLVDAGGGLGIPYGADESPLDLDRLATRAAGWCADPELAELPVLLEPGRYLVGPAGVVLARVLDVKEVGDRTVAILDAGIHTALRPALVGSGHRLRLLATAERRPDDVLVAGPLCTGLDVFPGGLDRAPASGDLIAILDLGAYGFSESMPHFLSHPVPAEVAVRSGRPATIRRRIEPAEAIRLQDVPRWADSVA